MKAVAAAQGAVNRTTDTHALRPPPGRMACAELPEVLRASGAVRGAALRNAEEGGSAPLRWDTTAAPAASLLGATRC